MNTIRDQFKELYKKYNIEKLLPEIPYKEKYTNIEIFKYIKTIQGGNTGTNDISEKIGKIKSYLVSVDKKKIIANIKILDIIKKKYDIPRFKYSRFAG